MGAVRERRKFTKRTKMNKMLESLGGNKYEDQMHEKPFDERAYSAHDFAIFRYFYDHKDRSGRKQPYERVVAEAEFSKFMEGFSREKKEHLNSLECIQSCIKAKRGLGRHIPIFFRCELQEKEEGKIKNQFISDTSILRQAPPSVKYDYRKIGREYEQQQKRLDPKLEQQELDHKVEQHLQDY